MTDILHQPLAIGDRINVSRKYSHTDIIITTILSFTSKHVRTPDGLYHPKEVLKINEQYAIAVALNPEKFI